MTVSPDPFAPAPAGLYIHIPYCGALCSYCDFFRVAFPESVPQPFLEALLTEIRLYAQDPPVVLDSVYLGGGTPSLLSGVQMEELFAEVPRIFALASDAEVTLEANPETVDASQAEEWLGAGVNRLSLGAQSFVEGELALLGRRCSPGQAREAVRAATGSGFENLSLDLMGGIPGQSPRSLRRSLDEALSTQVQHLSFYLLDLHRGTPLHHRVLDGEVVLPGDEEVAELYELAHSALEEAGFEHYEISNFARPGRRCRHNLKYWRGGDYIGVGPSAHGRFRGWLTANPRSVEAWTAALSEGRLPHERTEKLTGRRIAEDAVIFGLRLAEGVDLESLRALTEGEDISPRIEKLLAGGTAEVQSGRLRLTPRGFLVSNEVIAWLLPELERGEDGEA